MRYLFVFMLLVGTQFAYNQTTDGLVLYLSFDDTSFQDQSNIMNEVEPISEFSNICGVVNDGVVFNGQNSLNILSNTNDYFNSDFTMSFYMRPQGGDAQQVIMSKTKTCLDASTFYIAYEPLTREINVTLGQNFQNRVSIDYILPENFCWYHIAFVRTGAEHFLFVNGVQVASQKSQGRIQFQNEAFFMIGTDDCVPTRKSRYTGDLDELRFYNRPFNLKGIQEFYVPTHQILSNDSLIYLGDSFNTRVTDDCTDSYLWNTTPDILERDRGRTTITPQEPDTYYYTLTFTEQGCSVTDTLRLIVVDPGDLDCEDVVLPSSFTPNSDGLNDIFLISNNNIIEEFKSFQIYDRWGGLIFKTAEKQEGWDGSYKGEKVPPGSYLYRVLYNCNGEERLLQGTVNVLR